MKKPINILLALSLMTWSIGYTACTVEKIVYQPLAVPKALTTPCELPIREFKTTKDLVEHILDMQTAFCTCEAKYGALVGFVGNDFNYQCEGE